jgi:hypothetical protein
MQETASSRLRGSHSASINRLFALAPVKCISTSSPSSKFHHVEVIAPLALLLKFLPLWGKTMPTGSV